MRLTLLGAATALSALLVSISPTALVAQPGHSAPPQPPLPQILHNQVIGTLIAPETQPELVPPLPPTIPALPLSPLRGTEEPVPTPPTLPTSARPDGDVWTLTADTLTLHGLRYHGHDTANDSTTLRFTATTVELTTLRQRAILTGDRELGLSAARARLIPSGAAPIELRVHALTGSLLDRLGVPITLAAPLLPNTPQAAIASVPELTLHDATVRLDRITGATAEMTNTAITTGH